MASKGAISHGRRRRHRCLKRNIAHNFDGPLSIKLVLVVLIRSPAYQIKALLFLFQTVISCRSVMLLNITKNTNHANSVHCVGGGCMGSHVDPKWRDFTPPTVCSLKSYSVVEQHPVDHTKSPFCRR